ncbi:origin of replication complex subunit 5 [Apium graveolens]|uniref:origin of replication complex subunit 5 n=1 Tax=Apium graveolens TaxID=4045 RepID=UPI003D7A67B4
MSKDKTPQTTRRTTRLSTSSPSLSNADAKLTKCCSTPHSLTLRDLVFGGEIFNADDLFASLPGRRGVILELIRLLGPLNSRMLPLFLYGGVSTGKTTTVLQMFRHFKRPFVYVSCRSCYNPRILFESIINQLLLHSKNEGNGYSSAKRCEKPSDFVNYLQDALGYVINGLKEKTEKLSLKKSLKWVKGSMVYLIIDNLELVRDWDKSLSILPFLFKLYDLLKMPELGLIFISSASPDTYHSDTGYTEPIPLYFPDYTEEDLRQIFLRNQSNPKLYASFLDVVLKPFSRVTRRLDEISTAFSHLFKIYCEPLEDQTIVPNEETKRRLFSHLQPHIAPSLNEIFRVPSVCSENRANKEMVKWKLSGNKLGVSDVLEEIDFHMSVCAKYLLISAFLASRNPATLDASLFDSTGGAATRKRKRKASEKSMEQKDIAEQELLMKGPGTFPLERLLAIFQCITSVADYSAEEEELDHGGLGGGAGDGGLMSDVLLQLSSLCSANFISKGSSCPLEGSTRYRCTVDENMVLKVARSMKFPLSKYLYRN